MTSTWYQGLVVPSLVPADTVRKQVEEKKEKDNDENEAQETDVDVTKRDLIEVRLVHGRYFGLLLFFCKIL